MALGKTISLPAMGHGGLTLTKPILAGQGVTTTVSTPVGGQQPQGIVLPVARVNPQPTYGQPTVQILQASSSG